MRVVVDDERVFKDGRDATYLRTAEDAITFLQRNQPEISELYLDHDLGMKDGVELTVRPFVSYLEELSFLSTCYPIGQIFVITANHATSGGADWIMAGLRRYNNVSMLWPTDAGLITP